MQELLLAWYSQNGRDLPWRHTHDPYAILVSEVMLQQTRVSRVVPRYLAWLERMTGPATHPFLVCRRDNGEIAGVVSLSNVVLGLFRSGYLGYYAFAGHERQGLMRAGLLAVVRHAFTTLKLHRVEANIQPGNAASIALARSCGFAREGFSPRYLKIGGRWRDHERWARLAS